MADVIRQSIANEKFLSDATKRGSKVLLEEDEDKPPKQLIFR